MAARQLRWLLLGELLLYALLDVWLVSRAGWSDQWVSQHRLDTLAQATVLHSGRPTVVTVGAAAEALGLLADWALGPLALPRLQVFVATRNLGGLRLSRRTGFQEEGVLRSYGEHEGRRFDAFVLSRLPTDPARLA